MSGFGKHLSSPRAFAMNKVQIRPDPKKYNQNVSVTSHKGPSLSLATHPQPIRATYTQTPRFTQSYRTKNRPSSTPGDEKRLTRHAPRKPEENLTKPPQRKTGHRGRTTYNGKSSLAETLHTAASSTSSNSNTMYVGTWGAAVASASHEHKIEAL